MSIKEQQFWREREEYHDLAEHFDKSIEITHPDAVKNYCPWCKYCKWRNSDVIYYEYRGERF